MNDKPEAAAIIAEHDAQNHIADVGNMVDAQSGTDRARAAVKVAMAKSFYPIWPADAENNLTAAMEQYRAEGMAEERERCAGLASASMDDRPGAWRMACAYVATSIRQEPRHD